MTTVRTPNSPHTPHVVTLGTAGGPRWWKDTARAGIATAVVVGDNTYLVDCGHGVGAQMSQAGLPLESLRGIFITHLHSDHVVDLGGLAAFGLFAFTHPGKPPVTILGPGDRGVLPPTSQRATSSPQPVFPQNPTPGVTQVFSHLMAAHATDLNDRVLDALRPSPFECFAPRDIAVPLSSGFHPNDAPTPDMEPFEIYQDENVRVSATLVQHPPIAPAFAFRFDTESGSVTISGDTAACDNLVRIATNTELLLHEAIDVDWIHRTYSTGGQTDQASIDHHTRSHTSPGGAAAVADKSGAKALALHHLVPGNSPDRVWKKAGEQFTGTFHLPNDLDVIPFGSPASTLL